MKECQKRATLARYLPLSSYLLKIAFNFSKANFLASKLYYSFKSAAKKVFKRDKL